MRRVRSLVSATLMAALWIGQAAAAYVEPPALADQVASGALPPVDQRLPETPAVVDLAGDGLEPGRHGGTLRMLMGRVKDTRMMVVYGYARLVGYDRDLDLVPDILDSVDIKEGRVFTLRLRPGHRWSDGHPFTAEDFRYFWQEIATDPDMSPGGPPRFLRVDGELPTFEVIDATTVRYSWTKPNPFFLPALAGARPEYIYRPAHYLKQFHARHADKAVLQRQVEEEGQRNWVALHFRKGHQYKNDNPDLPTLQPWVLTTRPPSNRFVFKRNPYYHRVDQAGNQLPYIDTVSFSVASAKLIPAKAAAGETDLQARALGFDNYPVLKKGEKRHDFDVRLWSTARGAEIALYPNLNVQDPVWRKLNRDARFRRALSLGIDRDEINQTIYFGLAQTGNNTVLPESKLFKPEYATASATFDIRKANALLDQMGLTKRDDRGVRLMENGEPLEIIIETAGENTTETDVLQLVRDSWAKLGIKLHTKPLQREVLRNRIFAGSTVMSVWFGLENAVPTADMSPHELAPTSQQHLQWPKWGQHYETSGRTGESVDMPAAKELLDLDKAWQIATDMKERTRIWTRMLEIHRDQTYTIGVVRGVPQPVVVRKGLRNVPEKAVYNWEPGAHFGIHRPDTFWLDGATKK